jgi:hypothetical protein
MSETKPKSHLDCMEQRSIPEEDVSFEAFKAVIIQVKVFWVVKLCSISYHATQCHNPEDLTLNQKRLFNILAKHTISKN